MEIIPTTPEHALADGRLHLLGASHSVTGAMTRLELGRTRLLVDCGIAQGDEAREWRMPDAAKDVDAVVLTHGHTDHIGSLPALLDAGFDRPVYGTRATLELAQVMLRDGLKIQGESESSITRFLKTLHALSVPVEHQTRVSVGELSLVLHEAGHILGSASVEVESARSRVILSGDLGRPGTPLLRDPNRTWRTNRPVDLVVCESTYGDGEHRLSHADVPAELERIVKRALRDGGHILVPAFAVGRLQTLLAHLNTLVESGRLPNLPVAVDAPLGLRVTELHQRSRDLFDQEAKSQLARGDDPLDFEHLYAVGKYADSVRLRDVKTPMLVIAGNGMCSGGRIVGHLVELLPRPETTVVFVGYQASGTPGRRIQQMAGTGGSVRLNGEEVKVRASVETLSGLSAHADRRELLDWLQAIPGVGRVALHHGEPEAQRAFAGWVGR